MSPGSHSVRILKGRKEREMVLKSGPFEFISTRSEVIGNKGAGSSSLRKSHFFDFSR